MRMRPLVTLKAVCQVKVAINHACTGLKIKLPVEVGWVVWVWWVGVLGELGALGGLGRLVGLN